MLLLVLFICLYNTYALLPAVEYDALETFYNRTDGDNWRWRNATRGGPIWNFKDNSDPCSTGGQYWQGVTCNLVPLLCVKKTCHITALKLRNYNISGSIASEIANLAYLETLSLSSNQLTGSLPTSMSSLTALQDFSASYNFLSGPMNVLCSLPSLQRLALQDNWLEGSLPSSLSLLQSLSIFIVEDNHLTGTIGDIFNLPSIQQLNLARNWFHGPLPRLNSAVNLAMLKLEYNSLSGPLDSDWTTLHNLSFFNVADNKLTSSIPDKFHNFSLLTYFAVYNNDLNGQLPPSITALNTLEVFDAVAIRLTGPIPAGMSNMSALKFLYLTDNRLTGLIPEDIYDISGLLNLDLRKNMLEGSISESIGKLTNMYDCALGENFFSSTIPASLVKLTSLNEMYLKESYLSGQFPGDFNATASRIKYIYAGENLLTGTIPTVIGDILRIRDLDFSGNFLTGSLPPNLPRIPLLQKVVFSFNSLTGTIPPAMSSTLYVIDVSNNFLTGPFANAINNNIFMEYLYLHNNHLTGTIPSGIGALQSLIQFFAYSNHLTGTLPSELSSCRQLQTLLVQNNRLTGRPDDALAASQSLGSIDLSANRFTGTIPRAIFNIPTIYYVSIVTGCYTGSIPVEICSAKNLRSLILEGLQSGPECSTRLWDPFSLWHDAYIVETLDATIPECIWQLNNISTLHLGGNNIPGTIPNNVNLEQTYSLNLAHNRLEGSIPRSLQELPALSKQVTVFDLSHNKFSGDLLDLKDMSGVVGGNRDMSVDLNINRLSGIIPSYFHDRKHVNVLAGNLFECTVRSKSDSDIPSADPEATTYVCGSNDYDLSLVIFISFVGPFVLVLLLAWALRSSSVLSMCGNGVVYLRSKVELLAALALLWRHNVESRACDFPHLRKLVALLELMRGTAVSLTLVMAPVYVSIYLLSKLVFGCATHTHQYRWLMSSAYLSGVGIAVVLLAVLVILLVIFLRGIQAVHEEGGGSLVPVRPSGIARAESTTKDDIESETAVEYVSTVENKAVPIKKLASSMVVQSASPICTALSLLVSNGLVILSVKGLLAFLITSYDISAKTKLALQLMISIFDIGYNSVVMPRTVFELPVHLKLGIKMKIHLLLLMFNSIVAPLCVTSLIDKNCFANLFKEPDHITTYGTYFYCDDTSTSSNICIHYTSLSLETSFSPPFTYSFQCTSALLSTFTPAFMFTYTFIGVIVPTILLIILAFSVYADPAVASKWHQFLPGHFRYKDPTNRWHRVIKRLIPNVLHHLAVLLTFGTTSPILALAIGVAIISTSSVWILIIGWYLTMCLDRQGNDASHSDASEKLYLLEKACFEVLAGPKKSTFIVVDSACIFFAVLAMDIAGDEVGVVRAALCVVTPALCIPLLLRWGIYRYASQRRQYADKKGDSEILKTETGLSEFIQTHIDEEYLMGTALCPPQSGIVAATTTTTTNKSRRSSRDDEYIADEEKEEKEEVAAARDKDGAYEMRSFSTSVVESPFYGND